MLCYVFTFVPNYTLPRWFYLFVSHFWKNWDGYHIFFLNLLLHFLSKQIIRVTRYWDYTFINYVFRSTPPPSQRTIFFFSTVAWLRMMVARIYQFLVVWFDMCKMIWCCVFLVLWFLCATVAYFHGKNKNMERINFRHSLKNIPVPSQKSCQLQLIDKNECIIKRMRWKAHFFQDDANNTSNRMVKETYCFRSKHHPGQCKELETFEKDLYNIVSSLKY